jgi:hypothetical protein
MTTRVRAAELVHARVTGEPANISAPSDGDIKAGASGSGARELPCRWVAFTVGDELGSGWDAGPAVVGVVGPDAAERAVVVAPAGAVIGKPPGVP